MLVWGVFFSEYFHKSQFRHDVASFSFFSTNKRKCLLDFSFKIRLLIEFWISFFILAAFPASTIQRTLILATCICCVNRYDITIVFFSFRLRFVTFESDREKKKIVSKFDWHDCSKTSTFGTALHMECGRETHSLDENTTNSYVCPVSNILRISLFSFLFISQKKKMIS